MLRSRQIVQRGKPVALKEFDNLFAVRSAKLVPTDDLNAQELTSLYPELSQSELCAFQDAGWRFVKSDQLPHGEEGKVARVILKPSGRVALTTNRLTLQVDEQLSELRTEEMLTRFSSRVVRKLNFAKGLYEIAVDQNAGSNVLDVVAELGAQPHVKFAEPQFVEVIPPRDQP